MNANIPMIAKFNRDLMEFMRRRPDVDLESLELSTPEETYDLGLARDNQLIHNRAGDRIFITNITGIAYIRFNSVARSKYKLRLGAISTPFKRLYLTNTAQSGKIASIIIGYEAFIEFATAHQIMKLLNISDQEINPARKEDIEALQAAICGVSVPTDLSDVVNAIEELPEKTEIQADNFDQKSEVTVLDSITLLLASNTNRKGFYIRNTGDYEIRVGNSTVLWSNGFPLYPRDVMTEEDLPTTAAIYGRVNAGLTGYIRAIEET